VVLGEDAQASIVETFVGEGWTNRLSHFTLAKGARLMLSRRFLGTSGHLSLSDRTTIGEGASFVLTTLSAGGSDTRLDGHHLVDGQAGYAEVGGALLARGTQRHDANIAVRHQSTHGVSRQVWRSVADDRSTCSVAARVEVARFAQKTDGEQSLKGLLLARTATINAKPELEIFADDVKCAHGATVGELDRNALFYMASRGVAEPEAKALLTQAFVADALARIGEEAVREAFQADAMSWLGGAK
jgi:Fe-S cluster assembly protein SufD